ncbi:MAG: YggU family protein [Parachlamydiaceae bacterium]|nr:YggU family protein [Parachlamydiaceae bacterium]
MLQETNKGILFKVKIIPKSSRNEIVGWETDELKIRIAAVPEKGAANSKLIQFLSDFFSIGKSKIELVHGEASRHKIICLSGITLNAVEEKLRNSYIPRVV